MALTDVPFDQQFSFGSSLTIEELGPSGPGNKPRKIVLIGPSLPHQGAEWGFENQITTTWYPGNGTEATQQNLGPREMPSAWEGEWKRTLMGKTPSKYSDETGQESIIISPHVLREVFEDIARAGVRLRVTWNVQGTSAIGNPRAKNAKLERFAIVREGRVKQFRTPITRHTDIKWNVEFHWMSRGGQTDRVASVRGDSDLATASNALQSSILATTSFGNAALVSSIPKLRLSATHFTLGQLENIVGAPLRLVTSMTRKLQSIVSDFKRVGDIVNKIRSTPFAIANTIVDFARNTTAVANAFVDEMGRKPPEQLALKTKVSDVLRATNYFAKVSNAAVLNARQGYELDNKTRQILVSGGNRGALTVRQSASTRAGDIIAIHISKTGDTPQRVSSKYYSNPDQGSVILRSNRLPLYTPSFRPGQILIIPALTNAAAQRTSAV